MRRALAAAGALGLLGAASAFADDAPTLTCEGELAQGGLAVCHTVPGAQLQIGGEPAARADSRGWATLGFARDAAASYVVTAVSPSGEESDPLTVTIAPRDFEESEVGGLDCDYVAPPPDPEIQADIARSAREKNAAWAEFEAGPGATAGFVKPGDGIETSPYGSRRRKHGDGCSNVSTHWGLDLRAATGAPVRAPAAGTIALADNLYFEGGCVFIDHGQGLMSVFMHLSEIDVKPGDHVEPGDALGLAGMTGTANGPHIHWGLKWRNVFYADGTTGAFYVDPMLALDLPPHE